MRNDGTTVVVERALVWNDLKDGVYPGKKCWYPKENETVLLGESWNYIVEHVMSTKYKHALLT